MSNKITDFKSRLNSKPHFRLFNFLPIGFIWKFEIRSWKFQNGFTLLEMVVSIGIFSVLIVTAIGIVLSISNSQIKAANIQNIQDNIRFTLELMTKELRTGTGYVVSSCSGSGCSQINFINSSNESRGYCLANGAVRRLFNTVNCTDALPGRSSQMTADNVSIDRLAFIVSGNAVGAGDGQPRVTITMKARSLNPKLQLESSMDIQTTIIQRVRDQ